MARAATHQVQIPGAAQAEPAPEAAAAQAEPDPRADLLPAAADPATIRQPVLTAEGWVCPA